jgi:hypothetical protein
MKRLIPTATWYSLDGAEFLAPWADHLPERCAGRVRHAGT